MSKKKRSEKDRLKKEADDLMSKLVRLKRGRCEWCGSPNDLQHHHIIGRSCYFLRYLLKNALCLCYKCHIYRIPAEAIEFTEWLKQNIGIKLYEWLQAQKHRQPKYNADDYRRLIKKFKAEIKRLRNDDVIGA